jgi:hypothetical protein
VISAYKRGTLGKEEENGNLNKIQKSSKARDKASKKQQTKEN